jgi:excisionase family DNA binding protein
MASKMRADNSQQQGRSTWMTPREAAVYIGVHVDTIYDACAAGGLKHVKLGRRTIRLRMEWIDRWAEEHARQFV